MARAQLEEGLRRIEELEPAGHGAVARIGALPEPASAAVEHRRLQFRLNRVHPWTGAGQVHRQRLRGPGVDRLILAGPERVRKRLKPPDKPGLWQVGLTCG
jgi:hypothetical protein